jgi:hypothetical protein
MVDINTGLLTIAVLINGYLAWKAAHIASKIDEKTEQLMLMSKTTLDAAVEILARTKRV